MSSEVLIRDLLPKISTYGNYSSANYGGHCLTVATQGATIYFSYDTVVAFATPGCGLVVHANVWSRTTGKHLNWIDGGRKKERVSAERFQQLWWEFVAKETPKEVAKTMLSQGDTLPVRALLRRQMKSAQPMKEEGCNSASTNSNSRTSPSTARSCGSSPAV